MDDILELTLLYDFYGELLTKKQMQMFELYYMNDYSLAEVAENFGVSRQAVSELLSRVKRKLYNYEKKVGYMAFYNGYKNSLSLLSQALDGGNLSPAVLKSRLNALVDDCNARME